VGIWNALLSATDLAAFNVEILRDPFGSLRMTNKVDGLRQA